MARGQENGADVKISAIRACQYEIFNFVPKIGVSLVCGENRSLSFAVSELRPGFPVLVEAFPELIELIACDLPAERPDDVAFALPLVFYLGLFKAVLRVEVCAADSFTGVVGVVVRSLEVGDYALSGKEPAGQLYRLRAVIVSSQVSSYREVDDMRDVTGGDGRDQPDELVFVIESDNPAPGQIM